MVKFFLEANKKFSTRYKPNGPIHYPGRYRSICELVKYCGQYGFTREQLLPEIPKQASVYCCYVICKYVMDTDKPFNAKKLSYSKYGRNLAMEMGIEVDKKDYLWNS